MVVAKVTKSPRRLSAMALVNVLLLLIAGYWFANSGPDADL